MNDESMKASGDLIRWLKMLTLPTWARSLLAIVMLLTLFSALGMLVWGLLNAKLEIISSAVAMLTVGLPIGLIVVALVFGDGGSRKLAELTKIVLTKEIPEAILQNLASTSGDKRYNNPKVVPTLSGCIAEYAISADESTADIDRDIKAVALQLKVELNVKKANVVIWIPSPAGEPTPHALQDIENYQHVLEGALAEGYIQNAAPVIGARLGYVGFVFIKLLGDDFLINPGDRLYFSQDLAFFVRALLSVASQHG
ncbi:MAG TPA: hypothetical protein VIM63_05350 [Rhodoferax sp.]